MKRRMMVVVCLIALCCGVAFAGDHDHNAAQVSNPVWDKMKSLVGQWAGKATDSGQTFDATNSFRLVSDKSALMSTLGENSPYEMITMFHPDGKNLVATHYCAAHNQPRFKAVSSSDPNKIAFEFLDATNLEATPDGHMVGLVITFDGPDHHIEDWTFEGKDGKRSTGRFDFHRVGSTAPKQGE